MYIRFAAIAGVLLFISSGIVMYRGLVADKGELTIREHEVSTENYAIRYPEVKETGNTVVRQRINRRLDVLVRDFLRKAEQGKLQTVDYSVPYRGMQYVSFLFVQETRNDNKPEPRIRSLTFNLTTGRLIQTCDMVKKSAFGKPQFARMINKYAEHNGNNGIHLDPCAASYLVENPDTGEVSIVFYYLQDWREPELEFVRVPVDAMKPYLTSGFYLRFYQEKRPESS